MINEFQVFTVDLSSFFMIVSFTFKWVQQKYEAETGTQSLLIRFSNVFEKNHSLQFWTNQISWRSLCAFMCEEIWLKESFMWQDLAGRHIWI